MILKYGSKSNSKQAVRALSMLLGLGKLDKFTLTMKSYVKAYQKSHGLTVDGIAGPKTGSPPRAWGICDACEFGQF